jgi:Cys-tRNA(Pro)/Cys-tRNA(Cys) deacylase
MDSRARLGPVFPPAVRPASRRLACRATKLTGVAGHGGTRATELLTKTGIPHSVHRYNHDPRHASYGQEASEALGAAPERVFKTLVADVDGALTVAVVPVAGTLDLKALAAAVGGKRAVMAEPAEAERATGYVTGGITSLGLRRRLEVVVDSSALEHDTVFCSAGQRGLEIELAPSDLITAAGARVAPIARA